MRSNRGIQGYKVSEQHRIESASGWERVMILYIALKNRLEDIKFVLNKAEKFSSDEQKITEKLSKIDQICNYFIHGLYVDGECSSEEFERLYIYIQANARLSFIESDASAASRAIDAVDELMDIWKTLK